MSSQSSLKLNLESRRSKRSRLARIFSKNVYWLILVFVIGLLFIFSYLIFIGNHKLAYIILSPTVFLTMLIAWYRMELSILPASKNIETIDAFLDKDLLGLIKNPVSTESVWTALNNHEHVDFICNKLLLDKNFINRCLSEDSLDITKVWQTALELKGHSDLSILSAGAVFCAMVKNSRTAMEYLATRKLNIKDIDNINSWLDRIVKYQNMPKVFFGGIGRDLAFGYSNELKRFSINISEQIEKGQGHNHFIAKSKAVEALISGLEQSGNVAIVGNNGIGKTSIIYALAERLLVDVNLKRLKSHQVVSLDASSILAESKDSLEKTMLALFNDAVQSGNMIVFLDEAQLFFQEGTGSFDLSKVLLPLAQSRSLKIICAFDANDWQRLKISNASITSTFTPVMMQVPKEEDTLKILEDNSLVIESKTKSFITYDAIRESLRLSNEYLHDMVQPGKAMSLLEQSTSFADNKVVTARSVQQAIESTTGVRVVDVEANEADVLLNLEDRIHERMVNQTKAVTAVASALRRSRTGVSGGTRPIGSFLFLGPTGVGKTELAKSLAATYFEDEKNMIRLDMSEYQNAEDVSRLLDTGENTNSLLLALRKQPFSVVLLDEIEKAHGNVLNLLLQLLDEGQLTDKNGQAVSFKNAIVIVTSNAGANDIIDKINQNQSLDDFERPLIDKLISEGVFKPELVNRFDEVVLFRPLTKDELGQVALLMLAGVNSKLANQNIAVKLTDSALGFLVDKGYDPQFGSRPMRRVIQQTVEDAVANRILRGQAFPGSTIMLDLSDLDNTASTHAETLSSRKE